MAACRRQVVFRFAQGATAPAALKMADCRSAAMLIKSALRDLLSVSYGMKTILLTGSLRSPPPIRLRRTSPCSGGRINRSMPSCRGMAPLLSTHSPTTKWGEGGGASHQRGTHFQRPQGGCKVFRRQRRHKKWRPKGRRASPAQRYYITPEGGSPEPVREASTSPGQNPWRPGPKARRRHQPSRPSGRVNLREYSFPPAVSG